ncbi:50S ribosomal protein L16 [Candidatus Peregrinibacteria bacterium]|nr:50S ribosomal protein L16 [Candidatus Peregrinibacteria bacterium]
MLEPKKLKYRKSHRFRGRVTGTAKNGTRLTFGSVGLKAIETGEISARQIEAARKAMTHFIKRGGKIWIRVFPHKPVTQKAAEVPMGSGKGNIEKYVADIKAGTIIFEMDGMSEELSKEALRLASHKLPIKCKSISNY